eukprot:TRINITY_DN9682_c0_g1_i1.p1 TRINITY_DN9682_c0_g1~~TRINITY_DN9682_c0_g1_i1.p1  ORF type:complete len:528 (-),score=108.80 TRINITY_DN9682_c0_g1_i1:24-1607(-)
MEPTAKEDAAGVRRKVLVESITQLSRHLENPTPNAQVLDEITKQLQQVALVLDSPEGKLEIDYVSSICPLSVWMAFLTIPVDEIYPIVCRILESLLQSRQVLLQAVSAQTTDYLRGALSHPSVEVRTLVLSHLRRYMHIKKESCVDELEKNGILDSIRNSIGDGKTVVAERAIEFLTEFCLMDSGLSILLQPNSIAGLGTIAKANKVNQVRIMSLYAKLAALSDDSFDKVLSGGLLDTLFDQLKSDDLLVKLNLYEIIAQMSSGSKARLYLHSQGHYRSLLKELNPDEPFYSMTSPLLFNIIGQLFSQESLSSFLDDYHIAHILVQGLDSEFPETQQAVVLATGLICSTRAGVQYLLSVETLLQRVFAFSGSPITEVKINVNQAASRFFDTCSIDPELSQKALSVYTTICSEIGSDLVLYLFKNLRLPFQDLRCSSFELMSSLVPHSWALEILSKIDGVVAYLLNRATEVTKEGKEWKYGLVKAIVESNRKYSHFTVFNIKQLEIFLHQGPYFKPVEVAVEVGTMHT